MKLWLDDIRDPKQYGCMDYLWVKNYDEAVAALKLGNITFASLDHDIGACDDCTKSLKHIGDMNTWETTFFNHCSHAKSGYNLICWVEENDAWPIDGVRIHSMNPSGKAKMESVVYKYYSRIF
jgi:hypothetical protein